MSPDHRRTSYLGVNMNQRILVSTKAAEFEKRKEEHLRAGYKIEDETPIPINGFCRFTAVRHIAGAEDQNSGNSRK